MSKSDDFITMLYCIVGIIILIFIIDWLCLKPLQDSSKTLDLIQELKQYDPNFYKQLPKFGDRGIITIINDSDVINCALLFKTLEYLGCSLPIIAYYKPGELNEKNYTFLKSIKNVTVINFCEKYGYPLKTIIKPLAVIYCPFKNVLVLEPHLLFMTNPEYLFDDYRFVRSGAIFWKDSKKKSYWDSKIYRWVEKLIPYKHGDNRILAKEAGNYATNALFIINKEKHLVSLQKLSILTMYPDLLYNYFSNDKEFYWLSAELAKINYTFVAYYPGVIGEFKNGLVPNSLCGHTLHFDFEGTPLCWEGSVFDKGMITNFTHYSLFYSNSSWNIVNNCLMNGIHTPLSINDKNLINNYLQILHDIQNNF